MLDTLAQTYTETNTEIIAGAARGVDSAAADWAVLNHTKLSEHPADWKKHGNAAGPIRNQLMIDMHLDKDYDKKYIVVDILGIAFPGGKGTKDMLRRMYKAGIPVLELHMDNYKEVIYEGTTV